MKSDFHMHTNFSTDSDSAPEQMIEGAIQKGLQTICITDHYDKDYPMQSETLEFDLDVDSYYKKMKELQEKYPQNLWMNPADAKKRGLANEDLVEVWNDRGKVIVPVLLTEEIIPGVTAIAQGAWHKADENGNDVNASINVLTTQEPTPLAKGNPQHTNLVEVRKHD